MAFTSASGHGNLPNGNFTPVIYSKKVQKFFRRASTVEGITNTDYYGEIANFGDTVNVTKEPVVTVSAYTRGQKVTAQDLADDQIVLTVDKANKFAFKVDDIEEKHAHNNWMDLATSSAAYALRNTYDSEVLTYMLGQVPTANHYGSAGAIDTGFDTGEVSPLAVMNRLARLLDDQDVPAENRWLVAAPQFWELVNDENSKLIDVEFTGDSASILRNGRVTNGMIRGFTPYKTNNIATTSVLAGHMSSTCTASQIAQTEVIRDPDSFADICRGLHLYGRKTMRTEALAKATITID